MQGRSCIEQLLPDQPLESELDKLNSNCFSIEQLYVNMLAHLQECFQADWSYRFDRPPGLVKGQRSLHVDGHITINAGEVSGALCYHITPKFLATLLLKPHCMYVRCTHVHVFNYI